jgi:hypothetical protein
MLTLYIRVKITPVFFGDRLFLQDLKIIKTLSCILVTEKRA